MERNEPITMQGVHSSFLDFLQDRSEPSGLKVLDLGAGRGALTQKLFDMGFEVRACDLFPEHFKFDKVECLRVDITSTFPYGDSEFDLVIAIEVTEHILDHENFFREINRILKPGGRLYISTPNILSMKSRMRFLYRGFVFSFYPLDLKNYDGLQHVASLTLDQYNYVAVKNNFSTAEYAVDRMTRTSKWLYYFFYPFMRMNQRRKGFAPIHNQKKLLTGRLLFMVFHKLPK